MVVVKATKDSEAGVMPSEELLNAMGKFNEELVKAGVALDMQGLHRARRAPRIRFSGAKRTVVDGPFAESKELAAFVVGSPAIDGGTRADSELAAQVRHLRPSLVLFQRHDTLLLGEAAHPHGVLPLQEGRHDFWIRIRKLDQMVFQIEKTPFNLRTRRYRPARWPSRTALRSEARFNRDHHQAIFVEIIIAKPGNTLNHESIGRPHTPIVDPGEHVSRDGKSFRVSP